MKDDERIQRLERRFEREKNARIQAEQILEQKSRELFHANENLRKLSENLEQQVTARTLELRKARDDALASAQAKSDFLANMSHEIRTPMNAVLGMLTALSKTTINEKQKQLIETAQDSGKMLLDIINNVLDFTKGGVVGVALEQISFDLKSTLHALCATFRPAAEAKGLAFFVHLDKNLPANMVGDPTRLKQVCSNLLSNAIKFTERGQVALHVERKLESIRIAVRDTGIGISEANQKHIFQAFSQADATVRRRFGGTGLGLSICAQIVTAMQSKINLQSTEQHGSCFWFDLPLTTTNDDPITPPENSSLKNKLPQKTYPQLDEKPSPLKGKKILVVDDNEINLQVAKELLSDYPFIIECRNSGPACLEFLQNNKVDLLLIDVQMPDMDGLTLAQNIRGSQGAHAGIPMIAVTAHAFSEDREKSLAAGMNDHVTKPINCDELIPIITRLLQNCSFDVDDALKRMRGNASKLAQLITEFIKQCQHARETLQPIQENSNANYLTPEAQKTIEQLAHQLKGTGANLGAKDLSAQAAAIELHIKQGLPMSDVLWKKLWAAMDDFYKSAASFVESTKQNTPADFSSHSPKPFAHDEQRLLPENQLQDLLSLATRDLNEAEKILNQFEATSKNRALESLCIEMRTAFDAFDIDHLHLIISQYLSGHHKGASQ